MMNDKKNLDRKGQATLLTHTLLLGFVIFFILIIVNTFVLLHEDFQLFAAESEIDQLCLTMRGGVEKIFYASSYRSPVASRSSLDVNLPDKLADAEYTATFQNASIKIETSGLYFNATCVVGLNATYSGQTSGGLTRISFLRNTTSDAVEMKSI